MEGVSDRCSVTLIEAAFSSLNIGAERSDRFECLNRNVRSALVRLFEVS